MYVVECFESDSRFSFTERHFTSHKKAVNQSVHRTLTFCDNYVFFLTICVGNYLCTPIKKLSNILLSISLKQWLPNDWLSLMHGSRKNVKLSTILKGQEISFLESKGFSLPGYANHHWIRWLAALRKQ